jgi:hypothetical protein
MPELIPFIISLRGIVYCKDEVSAILAADVIKTEGEKHLSEEDGDELYVAQVTQHQAAVEPMELVDRLIRSRNDLIKTRIKQCWDVARELDAVIYGLKKRAQPHEIGEYDYGHFISVAHKILQDGEYPHE